MQANLAAHCAPLNLAAWTVGTPTGNVLTLDKTISGGICQVEHRLTPFHSSAPNMQSSHSS